MQIRPSAYTSGLIIFFLLHYFLFTQNLGLTPGRAPRQAPFSVRRFAPLCERGLPTTTNKKQPAQIAQTAFGYFGDLFCFLCCLLDRGRVK